MKNKPKKKNRRNVTLSLSDSLLKRAKLAAVRENKSLSEYMREALEEKTKQNSGYKRARNRQVKLMGSDLDLGTEGQVGVAREDLHERR